MRRPLTLGIDVGLTGVRATVIDGDGVLLAMAREPVQAEVAGGVAESSPRTWLEGLIDASRAALVNLPAADVAAVGISAVGPAPILVDGGLNALTPALLFSLDTRAEPQRLALAELLAPDQRARTYDNALPKLLWWRDHNPDLFEQASWALDATGWLVSQLTEIPTMDTITALEYEFGDYAPPVALPPPVDPLSTAGASRADMVERIGIPIGVPVTAGTFDSFVDIAEAGVRSPGDACCVLGTTLIICQATHEPLQADGLMCSPYPGDGVLLGGWTLSGGAVLDWAQAILRTSDAPGSLAVSAADLQPGDGGLLALPYLSGERSPIWDKDARGALIGLSLETTPAQIYRAVLDAVALSILDHTDRMARLVPEPKVWRAVGGGTCNPTLLQAVSDALGAPLEIPADAAQAVAPARMALRSLGLSPERPVTRTLIPDFTRHKAYCHLLDAYRRLHTEVSDIIAGMSSRSHSERKAIQ